MAFTKYLKALLPGFAVLILSSQGRPALASDKEHPKGKAAGGVTLEDVARHIEKEVGERKGKWRLRDKATNRYLSLRLDKVHRDKLSVIGRNTYFVCADFKAPDGTLYDVDFFVRGKSKDRLKIIESRTSIHKVNGKARYNWTYDEKKSVWKPTKGVAGPPPKVKKEHPK